VADRVLILGASARAAAASARRAGLDPFAIDLFADADTQQLCDCLRCPPDRYPEGLFELAKQAPPMPWMYTGGLENYPELIAGLARERELWGNGPNALGYARDPYQIAWILEYYELPGPGVRHPLTGLPPEGCWLRKRRGGSGGLGVRIATLTDFESPSSDPDGHYFQQFVPGRSMSVAFSTGGKLVWQHLMLGVTIQLVGESWLHAPPFRYAGNIGPVDLTDEITQQVRTAGDRIATHTGLRGTWGIDFVMHLESPYTIEVNPRYPASAEIIEFATGRPVLAVGLEDSAHPTKTVGKAIYYAPHRLTFPASGPWDDSVRHAADVWRRPDFADVPHPGEVIEAGHPVLTILTEADTEAACLARLQSRAAELDRLFGFPTPEGESCRP
jgi:predicted ATP-grasp superfamily ATP-dependent carboligase